MSDRPFEHVREASGPFLFVAGQVPLEDDGSVSEDAGRQAEVVLDRIAGLLEEHGCGLADVVKVTYFLTDLDDLEAVRAVIRARLAPPRPAASLVQVVGLVDPRFRVEVEAVAARPTP